MKSQNDMVNLRVKVHGIERIDEYDYIHLSSDGALVYGSASYIRFLLALIPNSSIHNITAYEGNRAVGHLVLLEKTPHNGRPVFNSLPFFGSHGGMVCRPGTLVDSSLILTALFEKAYEIAARADALSITIVENPLYPADLDTVVRLGFDVVDDRIGQISALPSRALNIRAALMAGFHQKTRNAVRKGQTLNQKFTRETSDEALEWLQAVHAKSIIAMGGIAKSRDVYLALLNEFPLEQSSRLYVGSVDGMRISGLLVLLFQKTVEYFTPVCIEGYREKQALSALIEHVMVELATEGYELWNWGGTWRSQEGVYRFKSRFGASDFPYRYFHKLFKPEAALPSSSALRNQYEYFYTYKYNI